MLRHIFSQALYRDVTILAIGMIVSSASASPAPSPLGTWSTANGHGVVAIAPCGDAFCGKIVGIDRKLAEPMPMDVHGHSQCVLTIITNQRRKADGTWLGEITDPPDGSTYQATFRLVEDGNLHLRGFIGIPLLGATQIWRLFTGRLTAGCGLTGLPESSRGTARMLSSKG
jgi:uncharacterized protein (DUF2147 family)